MKKEKRKNSSAVPLIGVNIFKCIILVSLSLLLLLLPVPERVW